MLDYRKVVLKGRLVPGNWKLALVIYFMPKHFPVKPPMLSSILRLMALVETIPLCGFQTPLSCT